MAANAAYVWLQTHLPKPFAVPLGTVERRGKSGSSVVTDRLALRTSLFLCKSCEDKMPWRWMRRFEYRLISNLHAAETRCDNCQQVTSTNIFFPEDGAYYQEYQAMRRHEARTAAQRVQLQAGQRLTK
jgi:hypothetical protein